MTLTEAFRIQARACAALESPFMERLLNLLADHWPEGTALDHACKEFRGDIGPGGASLPLRIAGGLHALVLSSRDEGLVAVYPPNDPGPGQLQRTILATLALNERFLVDWIQSPPQTNEVRRSAVLIAAAHWIAKRHPLSFAISELGASAGLNLNWDRFALRVPDRTFGPTDPALTLSPDWSGPCPEPQPVTVSDRAGVDLNPLDPHDPDDALRLYAFLWPDQPLRQMLTRAAIGQQTSPVARADAIEWLEHRLMNIPDGTIHMIYHTVAWQYFPRQSQSEGTRMIEAAGERATRTSPLAWLRMENDGDNQGAAVSLRLWPGDLTFDLGRADFHGRWIDWKAP